MWRSGWREGVRRFWRGGMWAILLSGCVGTTGSGDAGCPAYAEARLGRPAAASVAAVPPEWQAWIADLDDRMTGTCR